MGLGDGCPITLSGTYQEPTFFTGYAQQSGQTWSSPRPPWNVAGVDYPVGPPPGTVFKDPAAPGVLPNLCKYYANGHLGNQAWPEVYCAHAVNPDFENFDFSATIVGTSHPAVGLYLGGGLNGVSGATGTLTINNSMFGLDQINNGQLINMNGGGAVGNLVFTNNLINGHSLTVPGGGGQTAAIGAAFQDVTLQYNAFIDIPSRIISGTVFGSFQMDHNLVDGWMMAPTLVHGEIATIVAPSGTVPFYHYQYNTILLPSAAEGILETTFYLSNGVAQDTTLVSDTRIEHNVIITNKYASSNPRYSYPKSVYPVSNGMASFAYQQFGTAEITNNYFDGTGQLGSELNCGRYFGNIAWQQHFASPIDLSTNVRLDASGPYAFSMIPTTPTLTNGGSGFAVNDTVSFAPDGQVIKVLTVDGFGSILTYTVTTKSYDLTVSPQFKTSGAGTGAVSGPSCTGY